MSLICLDVCINAVATNCCHRLFCHQCITRCTSCPNCRRRPVLYSENIPVRRIIGNQKLKCDLCSKDVTRSDLDRHHQTFCEKRIVKCDLCHCDVTWDVLQNHKTDECSYRVVTCDKCKKNIHVFDKEIHDRSLCPQRLVKCGLCHCDVTWNVLQNHKTECPQRLVKCTRCNILVTSVNLKNHLQEQCSMRFVICPLCKKLKLRHSNLDHHVKNVCPRRIVKCERCGVKVPACEMDEHEKTCPKRAIKCRFCQTLLAAWWVKQHEVQHCPKRPVECQRCKEIFQAQNFDHTCRKAPVTCGECSEILTVEIVEAHNLRHCPKRAIQCGSCGETMRADLMEAHLCPKGWIKCGECDSDLTREEHSTHQDTECPQRTDKCPYCDETRSRLKNHMASCDSRPITCVKCHQQTQVCNLDIHTSSICPQREHDIKLLTHHSKATELPSLGGVSLSLPLSNPLTAWYNLSEHWPDPFSLLGACENCGQSIGLTGYNSITPAPQLVHWAKVVWLYTVHTFLPDQLHMAPPPLYDLRQAQTSPRCPDLDELTHRIGYQDTIENILTPSNTLDLVNFYKLIIKSKLSK
eukprot:sb/3463385/